MVSKIQEQQELLRAYYLTFIFAANSEVTATYLFYVKVLAFLTTAL